MSGGRGDAQNVRPLGGGNVTLLATYPWRQVLLLVDRVPGEHLEGERCHERARAPSQGTTHLPAALAQTAHEISGLVRRDAARDTQKNSALGGCARLHRH